MCFLFVLVLAPAASVVVTSGVYKRKPFTSQRKQGGMRKRPASHEIFHSNTRSKIPSEFCMCWLDGNQPFVPKRQKHSRAVILRLVVMKEFSLAEQSCLTLQLKLLLSRNQVVQCSQPAWLPVSFAQE